MTNKEIFFETADKIGKRLVKQAIWKNNTCTWNVNVPDRTNYQLKKSLLEPAGGGIYQGTAGIAVFLCELYKQTDDVEIKKTAIGAVKHAIEEAKKRPLNSFGFHSGRIGIAYAVNKCGQIFNDEEYLLLALDLILEMRKNESKDFGVDVIGGAGGSIPIILQLAEYYNSDQLLEIAVNLGENLISVANMELRGLSWGGNDKTQARNLCGFAHGAAGIGQALLELYNVTCSNYFLYATEQAFLYERQFFNPQENNWPVFRDGELGTYYYYESREQLKERAKRGEFGPYQNKYMSAWCHGAPGIGLSRLRAYEVLKDDKYKEEAELAIENTIKSISGEGQNYSMCHGALGNAETLIYGYQVLGNPDYLNKAEDIAIKGWESAEKINKPWRCGTMNSVSDPSFMLGEAGIGYYFLKIADIDTPSLLIPITKRRENLPHVMKGNVVLINNYLDKYFHRSFHILNNFSPALLVEIKTRSANSNQNDSLIDKVIGMIDEIISTTKNEILKKYLQDSLSIEKSTISIIKNNKNYTKDFLSRLKKEEFYSLDKNRALLFVHELSNRLSLNYNWNEYDLQDDLPVERNGDYLIINQQNIPKLKKLNMLTGLILKELDHPMSINNLINNVIGNFEIDNEIERKGFEEKIINQLMELYNASFIQSDGVIKNFIDENKKTGNGSLEKDQCEKCKSKSAHVH